MAAKSATTAEERRIAPRRQPTVGTVCRLDSPDAGPSVIALVWNISLSGISMLASEAQAPGTALTGTLETMVGDTALPISMKVIHSKPLETGDFFVGAHFDRPLTAEEMKPFVV